jgi:hypothetical protein
MQASSTKLGTYVHHTDMQTDSDGRWKNQIKARLFDSMMRAKHMTTAADTVAALHAACSCGQLSATDH